jgi:uncharacterized membrane protein YjjB (DUF3815 family)
MLNIMLKAKYSFISALVFFIVSNPELYKLTQSVFGGLFMVAHPMGAPTPMGLLLHTAVFFAAMLGLMMIPSL